MTIVGGIALIVIGAILTFALTVTISGIDLQVVGTILMLAGIAGLLLPLLVRRRPRRNRLAARSRQDAIDDGTLVEINDGTLVEPEGYDAPRNDGRRTPNRRRLWIRQGRD